MNNDVRNSLEMLQSFLLKRKLRAKKAYIKTRTKKTNDDSYRNILLSITEGELLMNTINEYWENFWAKVEGERFSNLSKQAFNTIKSICKYQITKGGLVNEILNDNGQIVKDKDKIAKILITTLKEIQNSDQFKQYTGSLPFPNLPKLSSVEIKNLLRKISSGKAMSLDLFSDCILKDKEKLETFANVLTDLWSEDLNKVTEMDKFFKTRLIALNKVHPKIPKKAEFRPIIIMSLIVKIMESRWLPKLQNYLINKLCPAQTGFVPGQGVFTNIFRVIERIKERTDNKKSVFGFFVDFKSAYNHVRHDLLFQRLQNILTEEEINFQKAIYDRLIIQYENSSFRPNLGVAQGSIISPALFDIYTEPMLWKLKELIPIDDIFAYADDILILCNDLETLEKCIRIIENWSEENNMKINKSKSAIMEFIKEN